MIPYIKYKIADKFPERIVFVTDVKFDDLLGLFLGYLKMVNEHGSEGKIDVVITNIINKEKAKQSVHNLFSSIKCNNNTPNVRYIVGSPPYDNENDKKELILVNNEKIYEKYFPEKTDQIPEWSDDVLPNEYYYLYLFAPFPFLKRYINNNSLKVFVGLGYNTGFYKNPKDILNDFKDVNLVVMNNRSKTIYKDGEGGRFGSKDDELWNCIGSVTNFFNEQKENAQKNSKEFAIKQINKNLDKLREKSDDIKNVPENLSTEDYMEIFEKLQEIYINFLDNQKTLNEGYYERIKEQIKKESWDIECSDGQHMALWLNNELQNVSLTPTDKFIDIINSDKNTGYFLPKQLDSVDDTKKIFIKMVQKLGKKCIKSSSFGKKVKKSKRKTKTYKGYTLVSIKKSTNSGKKLMATFKHTKTGRTKTTHFGAKNFSDFTKHRDPQRKQRYINRHKKRQNWKNPMSAGALSLYILWNKPTLKASIADYKRRFF